MVACSDTESTRGSVVVKKGLMAFKYLKLADGRNSEPTKKIDVIIIEKVNKVSNMFRRELELKVLTSNNKIMNSVGIINPNPPKLLKNSIPGLSKLIVVIIVDPMNKGMDQDKNLESFLKKGNEIIKRPSGITKN